MDGTLHRWLEEGGLKGCVMGLVDDATNTTLARLGAAENGLEIARTHRKTLSGRIGV
jgi:hypothetical protein